jgi:pyrophosphate--fructose-6-phosphate 1-phosphotransferase
MTVQTSVNIQELLKKPEVRDVTDPVSRELAERRKFVPPICNVFSKPYTVVKADDRYPFHIDKEAERQLPNIIHNKVQVISGQDSPDPSFKETYAKTRNIGIVFSGGPAPGGHNVIAGLFDAAKKANPETKIFGFLMGPDGIIENEAIELTREVVDKYRNLGGFGMIKTGRTKIDTKEKMSLSRETCKALGLDALVVVGGDDSNTNAAFLAQEMFNDGVQVIGVPKTIDGDIQVRDAAGNVLCAMSFGFHSAARAFSNCVSNLCTDSSSDVKYWHICKVMGRVASHLALEVALQTHASMTLIGEEVADYTDTEKIEAAKKQGTTDYSAYGMTLKGLSQMVCDAIVRRAAAGKNYGVLVVPEGVLEFINEIQLFIIKLNSVIAGYNREHGTGFHGDFPKLADKLAYLKNRAGDESFSIWNARDQERFDQIPAFFQEGLLTERDSHGNFQFSQVETEKVLMGLVKADLNALKKQGIYRIGIEKSYCRKSLEKAGLDPDRLGPALFKNYGGDFLLVKPSITSDQTLKDALVTAGIIGESENVPSAVQKIYKKSVPSFKTQVHFYGYDGRGNDPTRFDCTYTYNLGMTVFSLVANGATGQMAAIKNLEKEFSAWEPVGIPIAPLMHLEERKGKMELVLEKSVVGLDLPAFQVMQALKEEWLAACPGEDKFRRPAPVTFDGKNEEDRPITLILNAAGL